MIEEWRSPRSIETERKRLAVEAFDRLVDLALDGQIELAEAIEAFKFDALATEGSSEPS